MPSQKYILPNSIRKWLLVTEVSDVEQYAGELFRYRFSSPPPDYPRHYVALYKSGDVDITVGYLHFTLYKECYLAGGMCMDDRAVRRMPKQHRTALKESGGIAEQMLRYGFADLSSASAIFGYVGDTRAERVDIRVGFKHTGYPHLIVYWPNDTLAAPRKNFLIEDVVRLGPF